MTPTTLKVTQSIDIWSTSISRILTASKPPTKSHTENLNQAAKFTTFLTRSTPPDRATRASITSCKKNKTNSRMPIIKVFRKGDEIDRKIATFKDIITLCNFGIDHFATSYLPPVQEEEVKHGSMIGTLDDILAVEMEVSMREDSNLDKHVWEEDIRIGDQQYTLKAT